MGNDNLDISIEEYSETVKEFMVKWGYQINLLGGEPLLHPLLKQILDINRGNFIKTTIYTNGKAFNNYLPEDFNRIKLRVSIYSYDKGDKCCIALPQSGFKFDANFMVSAETRLRDLLKSAKMCEEVFGCNVFFISSIRELDNDRKEFFDDTKITMPVLEYKELVHKFLQAYDGNMDIHVSKRGVFESTVSLARNRCGFANYFIGGKIIQCPYDVVNEKYQQDYTFCDRQCQQNNTCLMSKIILIRRK